MLRVTCAIIVRHGLVFCAQRSETMPLPLQWEFPGGKIEVGETEEQCLLREIREELGITVRIVRRYTPNLCFTSDNKAIELIPFLCQMPDGSRIRLREHARGLWLHPCELHTLEWAEADIPIVKEVSQLLI